MKKYYERAQVEIADVHIRVESDNVERTSVTVWPMLPMWGGEKLSSLILMRLLCWVRGVGVSSPLSTMTGKRAPLELTRVDAGRASETVANAMLRRLVARTAASSLILVIHVLRSSAVGAMKSKLASEPKMRNGKPVPLTCFIADSDSSLQVAAFVRADGSDT